MGCGIDEDGAQISKNTKGLWKRRMARKRQLGLGEERWHGKISLFFKGEWLGLDLGQVNP